MMNISEERFKEERDNILDSWVDPLKRSSYCNTQVREVLVAGLKRYERLRRKAAASSTHLHHSKGQLRSTGLSGSC